jgi:hypothetical protein
MIKRIQRAECLQLYPEFPQQEIITDEEGELDLGDLIFPETYAKHWLSADATETDPELFLIRQLTELLGQLNIRQLIFMPELKKSWLSKLARNRKDYKPLMKAIRYFKSQQIRNHFDGGLKVQASDYTSFFKHFIVLLRCDGSMPYVYFLDKDRTFLGFIHYRAELYLYSLTETADIALRQTGVFNLMRPEPLSTTIPS